MGYKIAEPTMHHEPKRTVTPITVLLNQKCINKPEICMVSRNASHIDTKIILMVDSVLIEPEE